MEKIVSVIIPIYNTNKKILKKCISSVIGQTFDSIEIILVDDGSEKGIAEFCDQIAVDYDNIMIFHKQNGGVSSARNLGLQNAGGRYIAFVDSDDWVETDYIECLVTNMEAADADLSIVGVAYEPMNKDHSKPDIGIGNSTVQIIDSGEIWGELLYSTKIGGYLWNKLFKRDFISQLLDESLHYSEDFVFVAEYCKHVHRAVFTHDKLYHYRLDGNASSDFTYNRKILTLLDAYQKLEKIYEVYDWKDLDNVKRNTLKIALNLRARYKLNKVNDIITYRIIQEVIRARMKNVLGSVKVALGQKINILLTWMFPTVLFRVKCIILGRGDIYVSASRNE